jgi:hypothetical protein
VSAAALVLLALLALGARAEGALPAPPFALDVRPARAPAGQAVELAITPRGGAGAFDLYLMWGYVPEAAFLTAAGAWSPRPVAFRTRVPAAGPPITMRWVPTPPGSIPLALVVVPPGGDPLARFAWRFGPVITPIGVPAAAAATPVDVAALAPLVVVTLLACALVALAGKPFLG